MANQVEAVKQYLEPEILERMNKYWQAANYLTIGQIYLKENPLLREELRPDHIKPRLLGHWGTSPGLNFIYVHANRLIREHDANAIYLAGPGHGGPALLANVYLEGTYSEIYPQITEDAQGMRKLFRQFSSPGGVPSHVSVPTPGSIHEGGELGYVLSHAFGAVFDNPDLLAIAVVGDGEAETGPLEGAWKGIKFLNPARDGAVLPILHLNGYKISGPTVLGREDIEDVKDLLTAHGYEVFIVEGDDPNAVHQIMAETLDTCYTKIRAYQQDARQNGFSNRPKWPAIIMRTPKGWTGPKVVDDKQIEGTFRAHQVPVSDVQKNPEHLKILENWLRSYHPEELFDANGRLVPELAELAPKGERRMGANPHANGGKMLVELALPEIKDYALTVQQPATTFAESTRQLGKYMRDIFTRNAEQKNFRLFCPDETNSNRLGDVFEVENRCSVGKIVSDDDHISPDGRVMEVLSEHLCQGWLEGYLLTGRHGLFATYEAFAMVSDSMTVQHTKWLQEGIKLPWRSPISSLNILLTSTCWRNDHNGFSHQGPGLIDTVLSKKGSIARIYLPPDANSLLAIARHCFQSKSHVNLIVIDKQPQLQYMSLDEAIEHCERGMSIWQWASNDEQLEPDVVLACAGDIPTQETIAATWWLRHHIPELKVRVVNVIDLMALYPPFFHPHGIDETAFVENFTEDKPVVFAFHGYQRAIHEVIHGRTNVSRFHVRGFMEEGTTTTPFDMVVKNGMSRYHLCIEALKRAPRVKNLAPALIAECEDILNKHHDYVRENLQDMPEVRDWKWSD
ncbi:phosphoketolase family protein [Dictyobacter arantiisoli]|uniref:Putative phosphoketolase n=1 Tax=Dictyobacter arantiisoli TaxID=2014874 RepID=A0A5A5TDG5_9CHLR|nr:phosphoketolase family protein [Dictyobacter arantiisoli]GCF09581.1 putative phosphoketolase [Dictyobacter arantiisoli]